MVWAYSMACFAPRRQVLEMRARVPACGFHEAYSSRAIRTHLSRQGIRAVVHKRLIRSPHANAVADPVAGRWPSLVRERNKTTPNTAHQAVPEPRNPRRGQPGGGSSPLTCCHTRLTKSIDTPGSQGALLRKRRLPRPRPRGRQESFSTIWAMECRVALDTAHQDPDQTRNNSVSQWALLPISAGRKRVRPCTTSRRRTSWCRTHRRSWASSRHRKRAPAQSICRSGALRGARLSGKSRCTLTPTGIPALTSSSGAFPGQGPAKSPSASPIGASHRRMDSSISRFAWFRASARNLA
jgi:hypothetical protein